MTFFPAERLLARTFFRRLFENEVLPAVPQAQLVIWGLVGLAVPGLTMALRVGRTYIYAAQASRDSLFDAIMRDQVLYVTYSMTALGFIALLIWEGVFPDRRDARLLGVLPLSTRTHVTGRLTSLGTFAALCSVGINLPAAVGYGMVLFVFEAASGLVRNAAAHLIATVMAGWFAFFLFILAQGALLNVCGRTIARRLALALQVIFIVASLQALILAPAIASAVGAAFRDDHPWRAAWLPPAWFLACYDVLAGTRRPLQGALAATAVIATLAVIAMATVLIASSYRRLVRIALEAPDGGKHRWRLSSRVSRSVARVLRPTAIPRAVGGFTLRTVVRSRPHLTMLSTYGGVAAALVVATLLPLAVTRAGVPHTPNVVLLSVPLVLYSFVLVGMRVLIGIPTELKANWAFRLSAPDDGVPAVVAGVRLALLLAVVAPIAIATGFLAFGLWGPSTGAIALGVTAAFGTLLLDALLVGLRKMPFACTYAPGRSRAPTLWPFYVVIFVLYAYGLAAVERAAVTSPLWLGVVVGSLAALNIGLAALRRHTRRRPPRLIYEEEPPGQMFEGFKLSEGLAAAPVGLRAPGRGPGGSTVKT